MSKNPFAPGGPDGPPLETAHPRWAKAGAIVGGLFFGLIVLVITSGLLWTLRWLWENMPG